jgi:transcription elongation factor Elf1
MNLYNIDNEILLDRQIKLIMETYFNDSVSKYKENILNYNFRCNVCGDSLKSRIRKRAYILKREKPWKVYCHNCGLNTTVTIWMKKFFPIYYKNYISEFLQSQKKTSTSVVNKQFNNLKSSFINKILKEEQINTKYFISILNGNSEIFKKAITYCQSRLIPENIWKTWYIAVDGEYKKRLIIPFRDKKNKIYNYQARSLYPEIEPKYISRKDPQGIYCNIYNYYCVDKNKPVIIFEGPIDSIFVENAIGLSGIKLQDSKLKNILFKYFILDYDKTGIEKSLELLSQGFFVFNWNKFFLKNNLKYCIQKEKVDFNDIVLKLQKNYFNFEELKEYFTNNILEKINFIWKS